MPFIPARLAPGDRDYVFLEKERSARGLRDCTLAHSALPLRHEFDGLTPTGMHELQDGP
jgi:hypothetical protein